jgi:predicted permease
MDAAERLIVRLRHWLRGLFRAQAVDHQVDEELQSWLDELTALYRRRGLSTEAARAKALTEIGNMQTMKEDVREQSGGAFFRSFAPDFRDAWRSLRRSRALTLAILATFALGIGANTAIFSVVNAMLIAPLPYTDPSRLVIVWSDMTNAGYPRAPLAGLELLDLRQRATRFDGFGGIWATTATLTGEPEPEQLRIGLVTTNFFHVLGATPALGRVFGDDDETQTAVPGIVLSWPLFERRFGADPSLVGRSIIANGRPVVVLGVMPRDFQLLFPADASVPDDLQAWTASRSAGLARAPRGQQYLRVIGRMKPGVTIADARDDINQVAAAISREFTEYGPEGRHFNTIGLHQDDVRDIRGALLMLAAGVAILLVIACVNVTGLMVSRAAGRTHETAVRLAIGASRRRLFRQYLAEGLLIAVFGAVAGVGVGWLGMRALMLVRPVSLARLDRSGFDLTVLSVTAVTSLGWGLLLSLAPLSESIRVNVIDALRRTGQRAGSAVSLRVRTALVVAQIGLCLVLLIGAGLLVRTFFNIERRDLGFRTGNALTFRLSVPFQRYPSPAAIGDFSQRLLERLRALPEVTGAGAISHLPFDNLPNWGGGYLAEGQPARQDSPVADYRAITPGFFETASVRLLAGRVFTEADAAGTGLVVVVDDVLAARAWPGESAIGKRVIVDPGSNGVPTQPAEVIGVVSHLRLRSLVEPLAEQVYFSARQVIRNPMAYTVRTSGMPATLATSIRQIVMSLDPAIPIFDVRPFDSYIDNARAGRKFTSVIAISFAGVAMLLAAIGLYGVLAYIVSERRREFGVRQTLGATRGQVGALMLRQMIQVAGVGLALGIAAAIPAAIGLRSELVGVAPLDPVTYLLSLGVIAAISLLAAWIPVRRATAVMPSQALRHD